MQITLPDGPDEAGSLLRQLAREADLSASAMVRILVREAVEYGRAKNAFMAGYHAGREHRPLDRLPPVNLGRSMPQAGP